MRLRSILAAAAATVVAVALAGCGVDRSGTLTGSGPSVYLDTCSTSAGSTQVSWDGFAAASMRVTYRKSGTNKRTSWLATSGANSGTVSVVVPATAIGTGWTVYTVDLATAASGGGTKVSKRIDCAIAVTTTAAPTTTEAATTTTEAPTTTAVPETLPPVTTTAAACAVLPQNTSQPTLSADASWVYANEGTWAAGANCSIIRSENYWERSWNYGAWEGFSGVNDPYQPKSCGYRYRVTVVKWNQFGSTSAASAEVGPYC